LSSAYYNKKRAWLYRKASGASTKRWADTGVVYNTQSHGPFLIEGKQVTNTRENRFHEWERQRARARARNEDYQYLLDGTQDIGGDFITVRRDYSDNGCSQSQKPPDVRYINTIYGYQGPIMVSDPTYVGTDGASYWPSYSEAALWNELKVRGTTAIARTIPTNPAVEVGSALGESMERLPRLPGLSQLGKAGNVSKRFADEYLNYEFGLKPLISDARAAASTVKKQNSILQQLARDSGRLIRRRYSFPEERDSFIRYSGNLYSFPTMDTLMYNGPGKVTIHRQTEKRVWFSGAYTYFYDQGSDLWSRLARNEQNANKLLGLRLTPDLIWELSPWSWLADWATNAGDVMTNISAFSRDGLVLRWGYVMMTYKVTDTHEGTYPLGGGGSFNAKQVFTTTVKMRRMATPYGFGLDPGWTDLSGRQLAILGALGITRGR